MIDVLIIDDREALDYQKMLARNGLDAVGIDNVRDALAWLDKNHAEIVLVDLAMPCTDGLSFAEELRMHRAGRIGFLTGRRIDDTIKGIARQLNVRIFEKMPEHKKLDEKSDVYADLAEELKIWIEE